MQDFKLYYIFTMINQQLITIGVLDSYTAERKWPTLSHWDVFISSTRLLSLNLPSCLSKQWHSSSLELFSRLPLLLCPLQEEYDRGVVDCDRALQVCKESRGALYRKALCLKELGKYKEAYNCTTDCLLITPLVKEREGWESWWKWSCDRSKNSNLVVFVHCDMASLSYSQRSEWESITGFEKLPFKCIMFTYYFIREN